MLFARARCGFRAASRLNALRCQVQVRSFTSPSATSVSSGSPAKSPFSILGGLPNELDKLSPRIELRSDQIEILQTPEEFYTSLKTRIQNAKKRIYLSTLYIGKTEYELIEVLRESLKANPELKLSILTDALRGTRETPKPSCASLLAPLISEFGENRVEIRMFHTPNLTGLRKAIVPKRINEGWGLQHMKLYGIDDEVILSGANLSNDYFTNRQDRYHVFKSKTLTDYFFRVHSCICSLSFQILPISESPTYLMTWPDSNHAPSPLSNPNEFRKQSTKVLAPLFDINKNSVQENSGSSTVVYPILQFTPLLRPDYSTELSAISAILGSLSKPPLQGSSWTFTAGYFNMTPSVQRLLISTNPDRGTVIAASPWANGFFGSAGISGMLPAAYTHLSKRFLQAVRLKGLSDHIKLMEWRRGTVNEPGGWTYHAKGIWIALPREKYPSLSVMGSSNYTKRSYGLDLEANVVIMTRDEKLMKRLGEEASWLREHAKVVEENEFQKEDRVVSWKVRMAMWMVKVLGGAL